ncbi:hypothetical protein E3T55_15200 [Cryobacterium frigoriphilum]|uniref:Uncharacterized protein n=1 Tax=Cryobacterium frigoriphilum TaxID=1259150 RepID=A0A4R8ZVD6_9MICO|nr:hypothetical protein [Cryobacterium frigoriphilum]TFD47324.1 hypothetical protein E3T55_15200 [Cryobacterium frigoriphilum]
MMWHRYRWLLVTAPLLGFVLGVLAWAITVLGGNRQLRESGGLPEAVGAAFPFALTGAVVAGAALAGGWSLVATRDRGLSRTAGARSVQAASGAVLGVLVLALALGVIFSGGGFFVWYGLFVASIPVTIVTAIAAGGLVHLAERWHLRTPSPPVEHVAASPWTDF